MTCLSASLFIRHVTIKLFVIVTIITTIIVPSNGYEDHYLTNFISNYGMFPKLKWFGFGPIRWRYPIVTGPNRSKMSLFSLSPSFWRSTNCFLDESILTHVVKSNSWFFSPTYEFILVVFIILKIEIRPFISKQANAQYFIFPREIIEKSSRLEFTWHVWPRLTSNATCSFILPRPF